MSDSSASELIRRARAAQSRWAAVGVGECVQALTRLRKQIAADRELLVDAIVSDTGKPRLDALGGDVLVTLESMRFYERRAEAMLAPRRVGRSRLFYAGCRFTEHFEPHGTVLVFGPANYPLQLCLVPAATALFAGNAVVLKVSERTSAVADAIQEVVHKSSLPADLLQIICTDPHEAAGLIDAKPDLVFFTGSSTNGRAVAGYAAALGIPTLLELGGSDAALVFRDCNCERAVEGITYGAFSNAGQVCVGVRRLFIEQPLYERFATALVRRAAELRVGETRECDLGRLGTEFARDRFNAQVQDALSCGARLETSGCWREGMPVILSDVPSHARLLREEAFGPVLSIFPFASEEEGIELANASPFALGASVWTGDLERGRQIANRLNAGNCAINDVIRNIANPHAAFGGNAASGYGRYHGAHGLHAFSRIKTVMENHSTKESEINWFPLTQKKYQGLSSLIEMLHRPRGLVHALRRSMYLAGIAGMLAISAMQAQAAHLILQVRLPAKAHGRVAYLIFSSPSGFPKDKTKALIHGFSGSVGPAGVEAIDVGELQPGRYAASVYLDENDNGKLDSGLLGIPKEPVGASNNPRRRMGPPHFDDCIFTMTSSDLRLPIQLVRP